MAAVLSEYILTDDITILLGVIAGTLFFLHNLYKPQSLVHPILLGRQSDVARVRNPGESAVYRNYGTGLTGRLPLRPNKDTHILSDFTKVDADVSRTLWSTQITNRQLQERVSAFGTGLLRICGMVPRESNVLILLNDGIEFLISDLAFAAHSIPSFTISSLSLLSPVLDSHPPSAIITHANFLPQVIELIYDAAEGSHHTIIVVGEPDPQVLRHTARQVKILKWVDVESEGARTEEIASPRPSEDDVFTVSFFESASGHFHGAQITHENLIAGVCAIRALLPISNAITPLDTIVSAHSLSTAFGRAVAYTAVFGGTSFATLESTKMFSVNQAPKMDAADVSSAKSYSIPSPTILFLKPSHLGSLTSSILQHAKSALLYPIAWRHKLAGVTEGFISKDTMWDRLIFDAARAKVIAEGAGTLRGIVVSGGRLDPSILTPARIAFSIPLINAYTHPLVTGPILASHPLDLQSFPSIAGDSFSVLAHVGPPSVNIEAKMVGVHDEDVENGEDPVGILHVRGPTVSRLVAGDEKEVDERADDEHGWVSVGEQARAYTNGSFKVATLST